MLVRIQPEPLLIKICSSCKIKKSSDHFNKNCSKTDGLNSYCKDCSRQQSREYYYSDPKRHEVKRKVSKLRTAKRNQQYVWKWLENHPCVDCGESDIVILEFDHLDNKINTVSHGIYSGWTLEKLQDEIDKCEVRCANCHRRKTAFEQGWAILEWLRGVNG